MLHSSYDREDEEKEGQLACQDPQLALQMVHRTTLPVEASARVSVPPRLEGTDTP